MKKIIIPVIALLLVSLLVACTGQGGENTYTGDYKEYSNSSSVPSDMANTSGSDTDSSTVTVPLTTQAGATVPPVTTTQPTTAFSTVGRRQHLARDRQHDKRAEICRHKFI